MFREMASEGVRVPNGALFAPEGAGTIAAAFYPKPVIIRLSHFKTTPMSLPRRGPGANHFPWFFLVACDL